MKPIIYLDNAATTPALPSVAQAVQDALLVTYGNPSSLHIKGMQAEEIVKKARRSLATFLNVPERGIFFTSGGTEADNLAILGIARSYTRRGRHIVTSVIEHAAVLGACRALERDGWRITYIGVDSHGRVSPEEVAAAVADDTVLVSIMAVNNEVGTIQPLRAITQAVRAKNRQCLIHTDAVQALCKVDLEPARWGIDLVSVSAHKVHGPKGCGALWVREGVRLEPLVYGGGQEQGIRSGTENVPGIAGFGAAVLELKQSNESSMQKLAQLRNELLQRVQMAVPQVIVNSPCTEHVAPHICNLAVPGLRGEVLIHALAQEGVFVSSGAACSSHHRNDSSHVLRAMGVSGAVLEGSLRFSLSTLTTSNDIQVAVEILAKVVHNLGGDTKASTESGRPLLHE